jgi:OOP family OmpA-OmpF porin
VGEVEYSAPALSLQWHFLPQSWFRPYIGGGLAYAMYSDGVNLDVDDNFSWTAGAGIDVGQRYRGWFVNAFVKYFDMTPDVTLDRNVVWPVPLASGNSDGSLDLNPLVYGASIGYRFGHEPRAATTAPPPVVAPAVAALPPPDSDGDGVPDSVDRCPATPPGDRVGPHGCSCDVTVQTNFAFDSAVLTPGDKATLDRVAQRLRELEFVGGEAGGHTDDIGDAAYNIDLSQRRAQAVVDYLAARGVSPGRITAVGFGEHQPIASNSTEEGRAQNRRVVLRRTDCLATP